MPAPQRSPSGQHAAHHPLGLSFVVSFFAATVFAALMCAFWWFIASEEMSHAVDRKAAVLHTVRRRMAEEPLLRDIVTMLDVRVNEASRTVQRSAKQAEAYRKAQNRRLMHMWLAPLVSVYGGLLTAAVVYNWTRTRYANDPHHLEFGPDRRLHTVPNDGPVPSLGRHGVGHIQLHPRNSVLPLRHRVVGAHG